MTYPNKEIGTISCACVYSFLLYIYIYICTFFDPDQGPNDDKIISALKEFTVDQGNQTSRKRGIAML